jgi:hypothetical protein
MFRDVESVRINARVFTLRSRNAYIWVFEDSRHRIVVSYYRRTIDCIVRDLHTWEDIDIKSQVCDYDLMKELEIILV